MEMGQCSVLHLLRDHIKMRNQLNLRRHPHPHGAGCTAPLIQAKSMLPAPLFSLKRSVSASDLARTNLPGRNKAFPTVLMESRLALQMFSGRASQGRRQILLAVFGEAPAACATRVLRLGFPLLSCRMFLAVLSCDKKLRGNAEAWE